MSATPIFDKPVELALTMNLLKPDEILPTATKFNDTFLNIDSLKKYLDTTGQNIYPCDYSNYKRD